ncbi:MAG: hypothetical protein ABR563_01820 [Pyrinomonadaceae bacterium]
MRLIFMAWRRGGGAISAYVVLSKRRTIRRAPPRSGSRAPTAMRGAAQRMRGQRASRHRRGRVV